MQQRQLRLGDILDDYCPRERRVTNHAVVAMIGDAVKQTRCTTCDTEHEYKNAKVPRQRRKGEAPAALYAQVAAGAPKRVAPAGATGGGPGNTVDDVNTAANLNDDVNDVNNAGDLKNVSEVSETSRASDASEPALSLEPAAELDAQADEDGDDPQQDDGPVHRPLIRASLPRPEGQQPPARPIPEFTIRQPGGGRPNRFRPRHQRGGQGGHQFQGNRSAGNIGGPMRGPRSNNGRPGGQGPRTPGLPGAPGTTRRHGPGGGRKRSK